MRSFWLFGIGGVLGFIVDAGVLIALVTGLHEDRFSAKIISFVCAATATWLFNRNFTFRGHRRHTRLGEWMRYMFAMSGGGVCNYIAFSALVLAFNFDKQWLVLPQIAGSIAGLGVNYLASRYWIYRKTHPPHAPAAGAPEPRD